MVDDALLFGGKGFKRLTFPNGFVFGKELFVLRQIHRKQRDVLQVGFVRLAPGLGIDNTH